MYCGHILFIACPLGLPLLCFWSVQFSKPNISEGSVATLCAAVGSIIVFDCKFPAECSGERVLKIGQYLLKIWTRVWCLVFL